MMMMMTMMIITDTLKKMMTVIMSMIIMMMQASLFRILSALALDNLDDHDNDGDKDVENIIHSKDDNNDDFDGKED